MKNKTSKASNFFCSATILLLLCFLVCSSAQPALIGENTLVFQCLKTLSLRQEIVCSSSSASQRTLLLEGSSLRGSTSDLSSLLPLSSFYTNSPGSGFVGALCLQLCCDQSESHSAFRRKKSSLLL